MLTTEELSKFSIAANCETAKTQTKVMARLENKDAAVCPYCGATMKPTMASGHKAYVCFDDNHVAPAPDENTESAETTSDITDSDVADDVDVENLFPEAE